MSVVIVGGGLMGLSAAFHLRRADPGRPVTVLERARVGSAASGASAAGVRAMGRDPAERALALESLARWPGLDRELEAETRYRRSGGLRVALDEGAWRAARSWTDEQRADGGRQSCDVAIVTAGAWSAILLAALGARLPLETRPLQMLLTEPAPPALTPVLGGFEWKLSLKQLVDGAYLIGGGWPGRIVDHATNRWEVLEDSVKGSLEV